MREILTAAKYDGYKIKCRTCQCDFFAPFDITLKPGETIKIPTGIRAQMEEEWVLKLYPRSGLGFKFRLQLNNTVGVIDSDYYYSDNEGHIYFQFINFDWIFS